MLIYIYFSLIISLFFSILFISNPIALSIQILSLSLLTSITVSFFSSWISILLFLIYIRGILIIFTYFSAISSNNKLKFNYNIPLNIFLFLTLITIFLNNSLNINFIFSHKIITSSIFFYLKNNFNLLIFLIFFLFITLIIIINIINLNKRSLRPFNYV